MITKSSFTPPWYLKNPHAQTLVANLIHPDPPQVSYETLTLPDGDSLDLAHGTAAGENCVLILHGLEGSLKSAYAQRLMNDLNREHIRAVFMFFRGCNGKPNSQVRSYHSGETEDLKAVIAHLKNSGIKRIAVVGYSLGGNVTLKYLGEQQTDGSIVCASAISVPMLLDVCARRMNRGFSKIYQHELMSRLKDKVRKKSDLLQSAGLTTRPGSLKNFVEFDDAFTAPAHGFDNAQQYYQCCSSRQFLNGITTPTLILHSIDDPFMTHEVIPTEDEISAQVTLELSTHGGHVGFVGGSILKPEYWIEQRLIRFLREHLP